MNDASTPAARAATCLHGLSVGDAFGAQFFVPDNAVHVAGRTPPDGVWPWTDDTQLAAILLDHLWRNDHVDQDALARDFARGFDIGRGYGVGAVVLLRHVREGGDWRDLAPVVFGGTGSFGNGAAMRVAPLGAWFADDLDAVVRQARLSAEVTHSHPEGVAGAVAVAVQAALLTRGVTDPDRLFGEVVDRTPPGSTRDGIVEAAALPGDCEAVDVARLLGNGSRVTAMDTVPFCAWIGAHRADFAAALWDCVDAGGDVDTTGAIVGALMAARLGDDGVPTAWTAAREPLP